MLLPLILLINSLSTAVATVVNHNTCDATWSGYLGYDSGSIDLELSFTATVSIKTCSSYADSYVTIVNSNGIEIAFYDEDNCGYYSYGYNEDLLVSLPAGNYEVRVYSFWADYSWYSLEVAIIGCGGNEASDSVDVHSVSEDSEEVTLDFDHPLSSSIEVVSTDNCASTWEGRLGSAWTYSGQVGISLTETTTMWLVTCGSELDTYIQLTQHFANGSDSVIQIFDQDNCGTDDDSYWGSSYVNEDVAVELSPGHYTAGVSGWNLLGDHATLEVYIEGCQESWFHDLDKVMSVIIGVSIGSVVCCLCIIVGIVYCCGCCCFQATHAAAEALGGSQAAVPAYGQSPGAQVQMLQPQYVVQQQQQQPLCAVQQQQPQFVQQPQMAVPQQPAMVQQCVYTSD